MERPPGGNLGGLAGQRITQHRKKFHFWIIHIILKKINIKFFEKSLDLANFVNFADASQGVGVPSTPYWRTLVVTMWIVSSLFYSKTLFAINFALEVSLDNWFKIRHGQGVSQKPLLTEPGPLSNRIIGEIL